MLSWSCFPASTLYRIKANSRSLYYFSAMKWTNVRSCSSGTNVRPDRTTTNNLKKLEQKNLLPNRIGIVARTDRARAKQACDVFSFVYDNNKQNKKDLISIITIKTKSFAFVYYLFICLNQTRKLFPVWNQMRSLQKCVRSATYW